MALQGFDEALFAELIVVRVVGLGDAIGVKGERVARVDLAFTDFAIPILENSQHRGGSVEALDGVVAAKNKSGKMAAIGVAQTAGGVVVFGEEESGEGALGGVFAEELADGAKEALRLVGGAWTLA